MNVFGFGVSEFTLGFVVGVYFRNPIVAAVLSARDDVVSVYTGIVGKAKDLINSPKD